jgi:hypothetical protein
MERFVDWCKGIGLDGSKDYHAMGAVERFRAYEVRLAKEARTTLIKMQTGDNGHWGRYVRDDWLAHHLLYAPPPTSEGYLAPVVAYDDPEPAKIPIDEQRAKLTEWVIVHEIGVKPDGFDFFRVLVHWYTRLVFVECTQDERYKRLSKQMHTSFDGARRMLTDARTCYADRVATIDGLRKYSNCIGADACLHQSKK